MNRIHNIKVGPISFELQEMHDFGWLTEIGNPFVVFDLQDSGNICFGVEKKNGQRLFVKYAGAITIE